MRHPLKVVSVLFLVVFMSGCAEWSSFRSSFGSYSQKAADEALVVKVWAICNVTSRGALKRKFDSTAKQKKLDEFCNLFETGVQ